MNEKREVLVVGGGVAGLAAASELRRAGRDVLLLEARGRLGGRLCSGELGADGSSVEFGGAYLALDQQPALRALIERTGTAVTPRLAADRSGWIIDGTARGLGELAPGTLLEIERLAFRIMAAADRFSLDRPVWEQDVADLDIPLVEFLEAESGRTAATDLVAGFFTQLAGAESSEVSALWPLGLVAWRQKSLLAMLGSRIFEFAEGSADFIGRLAAEAGEILLGEAVTGIDGSDREVRVTTASGRSWSAEQVIVAAPVNTLAGLRIQPSLPGELDEYLSLGHPGRGVKVLMRVAGLDGTVSVTGLTRGFRHVTTVAMSGGVATLAGFGLAAELDTGDHDALEAALRALVPEARLLSHASHDWAADPWSRGTWMVYRPGEARRVPELLNRVYGRIRFAGSDAADQWAGNIEGAARSGRRAAEGVLEVLSARAGAGVRP